MTCRVPGLPAAGGTATGEMLQTEPGQCNSMTDARPNRAEDSSARPSYLNSTTTPGPASTLATRRGRGVGTSQVGELRRYVESFRALLQCLRSISPSEWREKLAGWVDGELHRVFRARDFLPGGRYQDMVGLLDHATHRG